MPGNLGNPLLMKGHNPFYIYISLLIILGGIGFPILVNFKDIILYHIRRFWRFLHTWEWDGRRFYHLYNLNTRIVLIVTFLLLAVGTAGIAFFEWNASFAGMSVADKWTQAFFNAACPRTAGFSSVDLAGLGYRLYCSTYSYVDWRRCSPSVRRYPNVECLLRLWCLNLVAVLRGTERVEVFGRELSHDSIRRSNATVVMSFGVLFVSVFIISILEPGLSLLAITFECVSAISTVGSSLNATPLLGSDSKLLVALLMFVGRVGLITLMLGIIKLSDVHDTACFLIEIMPIMFIPPAVGLMASWDVIQANLVAYLIIAAVTTIVVMAVSGLVTQAVLKKGKKGAEKE